MAINPDKEVFMFMAQYEYEDTIIDDGTYDDEEDENEESPESEEGV